MSVRFERVKRFADIDLPMPTRATADSAGYDLSVAEDIVIPPYDFIKTKIQDSLFENKRHKDYYGFVNPITLDEMAQITKDLKCKVTLVSTGMKCYLDEGQYLELSLRSSTPLKHWLIMGNSVGIIDRDYAGNESNDGEIFFQIINLSPFAIQLKKGDKIGQAIIKSYGVTDNDNATGERKGGLGSTTTK